MSDIRRNNALRTDFDYDDLGRANYSFTQSVPSGVKVDTLSAEFDKAGRPTRLTRVA